MKIINILILLVTLIFYSCLGSAGIFALKELLYSGLSLLPKTGYSLIAILWIIYCGWSEIYYVQSFLNISKNRRKNG